jgi:hypothetical protein
MTNSRSAAKSRQSIQNLVEIVADDSARQFNWCGDMVA